MSDQGKPTDPSSTPRSSADERADRLAAALRANLKRRKAADRARQARPGEDRGGDRADAAATDRDRPRR